MADHRTLPPFEGWPPAAVEFFAGLEADNSRSYWQANRAVYDAAVRAPMEALLGELDHSGEGRVFRPNRDIRFSKDKSPYKTNIAAMLGGDGGYLQLSTAGLGVGLGYYHMEADQLARYRAAVDDDRTGSELARLVEALRADGLEITGHDTLKTAPRGYPRDHPRIELLRCKGLVAWREWTPGPWLSTPEAKDRVVAFLAAARPLQHWLDRHVGPSEVPGRMADRRPA